ncbi:cytidine deaminase family protein [Streptomyces chartreusis]|uniref:cytidine deaminase family protein n=1 Tax=Streptomyces chartreusis TaxID=1969 RepID=UPI00365EB27E
MANAWPLPNVPADELDRELMEEATTLLLSRRRAGFHSVAAVALASSGRRYASLDVRSRKNSVCAEPGAIAAAHSVGDYDIRRIAAVVLVGPDGRTGLISPCGSCRELINYQSPDCEILFDVGGRMARIKSRDLFPFGDIAGQPEISGPPRA